TGSAGSGGTVSLDAASTLRVDAGLDVSGNMGDAGEIDLNPNDNNVDVVVNAKLDGSAASGGGVLSIGSSHNIEFTVNSSVNMNAVGIIGGPGGEVTLTARNDVTFDTGAAGLVIGRKGITVSGAVRTTRQTGTNTACSSTPPQTAGARIINPPLAPCPAGFVRPLCTGRDPTTRALVPDGCLVPCPACGNGAPPEFPEECDDGNTADCDGCDPHCRLPARATC